MYRMKRGDLFPYIYPFAHVWPDLSREGYFLMDQDKNTRAQSWALFAYCQCWVSWTCHKARMECQHCTSLSWLWLPLVQSVGAPPSPAIRKHFLKQRKTGIGRTGWKRGGSGPGGGRDGDSLCCCILFSLPNAAAQHLSPQLCDHWWCPRALGSSDRHFCITVAMGAGKFRIGMPNSYHVLQSFSLNCTVESYLEKVQSKSTWL